MLAISSHAAVISESSTVTISTRPFAISASTSSRCAGSAMRIAEASVVARSAACTETMRVDAPSSEKPFAYATLLPPPP